MYAEGSSVIICGCAAISNPPVIFPPAGTPSACLATGSATSLQKRILAFSAPIGSYRFTCNLDSNGNPFQDCLNAMAEICNPSYLGVDTTRINYCRDAVNSMAGQMNVHWQLVRKECGQWKWTNADGTIKIGSASSTNCSLANIALQQNAFYISGGVRINVPASMTESINKGLWKNPYLNG